MKRLIMKRGRGGFGCRLKSKTKQKKKSRVDFLNQQSSKSEWSHWLQSQGFTFMFTFCPQLCHTNEIREGNIPTFFVIPFYFNSLKIPSSSYFLYSSSFFFPGGVAPTQTHTQMEQELILFILISNSVPYSLPFSFCSPWFCCSFLFTASMSSLFPSSLSHQNRRPLSLSPWQFFARSLLSFRLVLSFL